MDLRAALIGFQHDLNERLKNGTSDADIVSWIDRKRNTWKVESRGVFAGVEREKLPVPLCPGCGSPTEAFSYRENGRDFPSRKCTFECGWWG